MKVNQAETMLIFILREQRVLYDLPHFCSTSVWAEGSTGIVTRGCFQLTSSPVVMLTLHISSASLAPSFSFNFLWAGSVEMTEQNTPSSTNKVQDAGCKRQ